jgi:transposase-like protein
MGQDSTGEGCSVRRGNGPTQAVARQMAALRRREDCPHCGADAMKLAGQARRFFCEMCERVFYVPKGL